MIETLISVELEPKTIEFLIWKELLDSYYIFRRASSFASAFAKAMADKKLRRTKSRDSTPSSRSYGLVRGRFLAEILVL